MAWKMGAPLASFVAATTVNDAVPRYLETGRFEPRPSVPTLANAMDVGNPSNFERLQWLFDGDRDAMRAADLVECSHRSTTSGARSASCIAATVTSRTRTPQSRISGRKPPAFKPARPQAPKP